MTLIEQIEIAIARHFPDLGRIQRATGASSRSIEIVLAAMDAEHAPVLQAARDLESHGYNRYSRGCRCGPCRAGKVEYMRAQRATRTDR